VCYKREGVSRKICKEVEDNIIRELASEKQLIDDKAMPVWSYNYSYIRDQIRKKYAQEVSLTTIISRAKKTVFYIPKREKRIHDREISTHYVDELIQHDSSYHRWSPYVEQK